MEHHIKQCDHTGQRHAHLHFNRCCVCLIFDVLIVVRPTHQRSSTINRSKTMAKNGRGNIPPKKDIQAANTARQWRVGRGSRSSKNMQCIYLYGTLPIAIAITISKSCSFYDDVLCCACAPVGDGRLFVAPVLRCVQRRKNSKMRVQLPYGSTYTVWSYVVCSKNAGIVREVRSRTVRIYDMLTYVVTQ